RFRLSQRSTLAGLRQPLVQADAANARFAERHQRLFFDAATEVPRVAIRRDRPCVAYRLQITRNDVRERSTVRASDFHYAVHWGLKRDLREDRRNVVRRDRLKQSVADAHGPTVRTEISDTANKFHKLRRAHDRVRHAGRVDRLFLRDLGSEIRVLLGAVTSDDGKRDVMAYSCGHFSLAEVARRGTEKVEHRLRLP